ncbi:MAG: TolB family protein [Candidatus Acidiferrales bacterium]
MTRRAKISAGILVVALVLLASCGGVINLPVPVVSSLSPSSVPENSVTFTLQVMGSGFAPSSTIAFNGAPRQTIFLRPDLMTTQVNPSDVATPGTITVQVFTPAPGGGTSQTIAFTVTATSAPVPAISSISPTSISAAGQSAVITINGSNFVPTSVVTVNGANRQTNFTNGGVLTVGLQSSDITTAGTLRIAVLNPPASGVTPPGGGVSNVILLNVVNPNPVISAVSPPVVVAGSTTNASLRISGSGFDSASQVLVNGSGRPTTFGSSGVIDAQLASGDLAAAGTYPVQVVNPTPGGGTSATLFFSIVPSAAGAGLPALVDVAADGAQANDGAGDPSISGPAMDATGRFVAFTSPSTNLLETTITNPAPNPITNGAPNIFLRDTCLGVTNGCTPREILVNVGPSGILANGASSQPAVASTTANIVAFSSLATDLVSGFSFDGTTPQIYAANPCAGVAAGCTPTIGLVSVGADGITPALGSTSQPSVSPDGRFIAFTSTATNLVAGATTGSPEVYLRDTCLAAGPACKSATMLVSVAADGVTPADGSSSQPVVESTKNGQFVAFTSTATNLVTGSGGTAEIYRVGYCIAITKGCKASSAQLISTPDGTVFANGSSVEPTMTPDGRFVAFASSASNLGATSGGIPEIYLRDTCQGVATGCSAKTMIVSLAADNVTPADALSEHPSLGNAGQFVAFASQASNLSMANLNGLENIYVHNTCINGANGCKASTALVSVPATRASGNGASLNPVISGTGHVVSFFSAASNLVNNDLNGFPDIFLAITTF